MCFVTVFVTVLLLNLLLYCNIKPNMAFVTHAVRNIPIFTTFQFSVFVTSCFFLLIIISAAVHLFCGLRCCSALVVCILTLHPCPGVHNDYLCCMTFLNNRLCAPSLYPQFCCSSAAAVLLNLQTVLSNCCIKLLLLLLII